MSMRVNKDSALVDRETGEAKIVKEGSWITTPEDIEKKKERENKKLEMNLRRAQTEDMGNYVLVPTKQIEQITNHVSQATLGRLSLLATYTDYNNRLMLNEHTVMQKANFSDVLKLNRTATYSFCKDVMPDFLEQRDDGCWYINNFTYRGNNNNWKQNYKTKLFITTAQNLYERMKSTKHRYFGKVMQLIPHINIQYNIVCHNPFEMDINRIEPFSIEELCTALEYDSTNSQRLVHELCDALFEYRGRDQRLCAVTTFNDGDSRKSRIIVNPRLLYNGKDVGQVDVLCTFFPDTQDD